MEESTPKVEDSTDEQLIEDICQLNRIALGEGDAACQVCGTELPDGAPVTVFAYRPAGQPTYELAYVSCGENEHDLPTYFTLGVRDLLVDGHVGRCTEPLSNTSWTVLLDPAIRAVSPTDSTTAQIAPSEPDSPQPSQTPNATISEGEPTEGVTWVYGDALLERASTHATRTEQPTDDELITAQPSSTTATDHDHSTEDEVTEGGEC